MFASFRAHTKSTNIPFQTFLFLHISFGLPGTLWTAFELQTRSEDVNESAGGGYTNDTCTWLAKNGKNKSKVVFDCFPNFPTNQKWQIWGWLYTFRCVYFYISICLIYVFIHIYILCIYAYIFYIHKYSITVYTLSGKYL